MPPPADSDNPDFVLHCAEFGIPGHQVGVVLLGGAEVAGLVSADSVRATGLQELGADKVVSNTLPLRDRLDLILAPVDGETLAHLMKTIDPLGTIAMFGNSSGQLTNFNVRNISLDSLIRVQGFELFYRAEPFRRDLGYLARLVAEARLILKELGSCGGSRS
jgi:NADPH:quinone reductase-like Zn-dependent oxidoreductase